LTALAGGQVVNQDPSNGVATAVSPDGTHAAVIADHDGHHGAALVVLDAGRDARTLLTAPVTSAAFSADGSRLGYAVAGPGLRVTGYGPPLRCLP